MEMISKVLVPVDFSLSAQKAFCLALALNKLLEIEIHLLHVIYPQMENIDEPLASSQKATYAKKHIAEEKMRAFIKKGLAGRQEGKKEDDIYLHVELGGAVAVIKSLVKEKKFDLIIIGTRAKHEKVENLLGTTASDVVGNASCPVIVVPESAGERPIAKVAHALDVAWVKSEHLIKVVRMFLPLHQEVHLVRFSESANGTLPAKLLKIRDALQEDLPDIPVVVHALEKQALVSDINQFVQREGIDLLIMYRSQLGLLKKLFHRSQTREMAKKTLIPLLVV